MKNTFFLLLKEQTGLLQQQIIAEKDAAISNLLYGNVPPEYLQRLHNGEHFIFDQVDDMFIVSFKILDFDDLLYAKTNQEKVDLLNVINDIWSEACEEFGMFQLQSLGEMYLAASTSLLHSVSYCKAIIQKFHKSDVSVCIGIHRSPCIIDIHTKERRVCVKNIYGKGIAYSQALAQYEVRNGVLCSETVVDAAHHTEGTFVFEKYEFYYLLQLDVVDSSIQTALEDTTTDQQQPQHAEEVLDDDIHHQEEGEEPGGINKGQESLTGKRQSTMVNSGVTNQKEQQPQPQKDDKSFMRRSITNVSHFVEDYKESARLDNYKDDSNTTQHEEEEEEEDHPVEGSDKTPPLDSPDKEHHHHPHYGMEDSPNSSARSDKEKK